MLPFARRLNVSMLTRWNVFIVLSSRRVDIVHRSATDAIILGNSTDSDSCICLDDNIIQVAHGRFYMSTESSRTRI
jgi:hypothetical protein